MSKCDLGIEFDRPDRRYRTGETVSGRIHIRANTDFKCDALEAQLMWKAHGRGNTATGPIWEAELFSGPVGKGWQRSFPFSFVLPTGPVTYHGGDLNVDWYVRAVADIPWALDPKVEEDLVVEANHGATSYHPDYYRPEKPSNAVSGGGVFFGLLTLGAGLTAMLVVATVIAVIFGVLLLALGGYLLFNAMQNALATAKLGNVWFRTRPAKPVAGDTMIVEASFTPRQDGPLNAASFVIHCQEIVTRGHGTDSTTYRNSIWKTDKMALPRLQMRAGEPVVLQERFLLPDNAPPSFKATDNQLKWTLELHIDIPGWPDWQDTLEFDVLPRVVEQR